ncbi:hypothetical protein KQX54_004206 [Cotesia glomerata]|uniref:Uncharacterized protein n=1 Tax=Cotesia glomerata TaxID=32391 RepID=A0AAV7HNZ8_COTGL|nr:hypothetical protein KQX54_004206 [Cotesia glomerata]
MKRRESGVGGQRGDESRDGGEEGREYKVEDRGRERIRGKGTGMAGMHFVPDHYASFSTYSTRKLVEDRRHLGT